MSYKAIWSKEKSKLNNIELIKLKRDGLDVITTIVDKYAGEGYGSISEEDQVLLKWAGIYEQKPRDGHFMMRVRINSGIMNTKQARVIAGVSSTYGRDKIKITSRGAIQFYWIRLEHLPDIFSEFGNVGLSTFEACGDCPRTIVGNPLAGIDRYELMDTTSLVKKLNDFFLLNRDFSNLPRKLKISISSSIFNNAHKEINDLSFTPAVKVIDGKEIIGFNVWVGGGLSVEPFISKQLDIFVSPQNVLNVAAGVATIFRDYGYRESRSHSRLKFLVNDWGTDKFKDYLIKLTGELPSKGEEKTISWNGAYFYGVNTQRQEDKNYIGLNIPLGYMSSQDLSDLVEISEKYGDGKLRTTMSQNMIVSGIESSFIPELLKKPIFNKFSPNPSSFIGHIIACTGNEYCNLAQVDTIQKAKNLAEYLDCRIKTDLPVRIHFVGCPNSCGHVQIADIGLRGALIKSDLGKTEAFDVFVGAVLGPNAKFNTKLTGRVKAEQLNALILDFISFYNRNHLPQEAFHQFVERIDASAFQDILNQYVK